MSTSEFTKLTTSKQWVLQHIRVEQCAPLIRKHLAAVLAGAGIATVLFVTIGLAQTDWKDISKRTILDSPFTPTPATGREGGAVYTRWGRTTCPELENELVYLGYAGGSYYTHTGSGANILCLPDEPEWGEKDDAVHDQGLVYGLEYELLNNIFPFESTNAAGGTKLHDHNMPCAVCRSTARMTAMMIPAKKTCPDGWSLEYWGYLASAHHAHQRSEYTCVDRAPEGDEAGFRNEDGALVYAVEGKCGSLPCPPYVDGWELTCVVCTR